MVLRQEEIKEFDVDVMAIRVFLKSLEIIGGPRKLIEYRNLTWIPSLMEASYAIVLHDMLNYTESEIAEFLGVSEKEVKDMLSFQEDFSIEEIFKFKSKPEMKKLGSLVRIAYKKLKEKKANLKEIMEIIYKHKDELAKNYGVKEIGIFGSVRRGENREDSDVDILVEFERPISLFKFLELEEYLSNLIGMKVDLVSKKALKPHIGKHVLKEVEKI